jgi:hypothetical protein
MISRSDLKLLTGRLMTSRYQTWRPGDGVPVRTTVGAPKFWNHGPMPEANSVKPFGVFGRSDLSDDEACRTYWQRLDWKKARLISELTEIAQQHEGKKLVLLCFEDVYAGEICHRRWFADWFEERFGIEVPELPAPLPKGVQGRLL